MRSRVRRWLRGNARVGSADPEQAAFSSPLVIAGQRPRWVYRSEPINSFDSGWRFLEGHETDEWLNAAGNCVMEHLGHMSQRWPELRGPLADERERSTWEWDEQRGAYVEVGDWSPPS
jgi:hypothetical protein